MNRWWRNLCSLPWTTRRRFDKHTLRAIEKAITSLESRHAGELRFAVEHALDWPALWAGQSARDRAIEVFGYLRVWDTEANNGVLIYVLMAEHDVEIVADRGLTARVSAEEWTAVCQVMEEHYRAGRYREGSIAGLERVGEILARHFPQAGGDVNEQPNRPVML